METFDAITSLLDVREYADKPVPKEVKFQVLEAGRMTSETNPQHWRFLLYKEKKT